MSARLFLALAIVVVSDVSFADSRTAERGSPCAPGLAQQVTDAPALLNELVQLAVRGEKGEKFEHLFAAYQKASGLSAEDIHEAITLQVQLLQAEANTELPGEGPITEQAEAEAKAAYQFARQNGLTMQAAFMAAVKSGDEALVRGFLVMSRQTNNICKGEPGYARYCKTLDLEAGWQRESFLLEAGKVSSAVALILIAEGLSQPFSAVIGMPDEAIALKLLEKGQPFSSEDLIKAIALKENEIVKEALKLYPNLASAALDNSETPLRMAATHQNEEIVELLLQTYKVDPNQQTKDGGTALLVSIYKGNMKIFEGLLDAGADVNLAKENGWTPLHAAVSNYKNSTAEEMVKELLFAGAQVNAVFSGSTEIPSPNVPGTMKLDSSDWTPLKIITQVCAIARDRTSEPNSLRLLLEKNGGNER